jgi:hypothetical protein
MFQKFLNFIKYNNAFTIILGMLFLGGGVTFAASPTARESVYSSQSTVISVDNGVIVSTNLDDFNFNLRINSITEDNKNYYAGYSYQTLAVENDIWQTKQIEKTLTVSKEDLNGKDLGLYVAKELGENMNYELSYLKRVQKLEREKGESQKIVTTEYSGLIGKMLDPKEEVIEGYSPVIPEPVPQTAAVVESRPQFIVVSVPSGSVSEQTSNTPVDSQLVNKVVDQLVKDEASSTPALEPATSTQETTPIQTELTPTPEPEPETIPAPTTTETPAEPAPETPAEPTQ